jgi:Domain of unknown function (DUF4398)
MRDTKTPRADAAVATGARLSHNTVSIAPFSRLLMTPTRPKIHRPVVLFCLLLVGCGPTKPPNTGLEEAAQHLRAARDAGASTYAPLELRAAEERLSAGRAAADKRHYDDAIKLAQEAQINSDLAAAKARLGKVRERVEARTRENARLREELGIPAESGAPQ